jgi:hypothetical protein
LLLLGLFEYDSFGDDSCSAPPEEPKEMKLSARAYPSVVVVGFLRGVRFSDVVVCVVIIGGAEVGDFFEVKLNPKYEAVDGDSAVAEGVVAVANFSLRPDSESLLFFFF